MTELYDDDSRIRAAVEAYQMNFTGDPYRAMGIALDVADRVGGPYLVPLARVVRKLDTLRATVLAARSQLAMVIEELDNVARAVDKVKPPTNPGAAVEDVRGGLDDSTEQAIIDELNREGR
jgi:hypothetical protein